MAQPTPYGDYQLEQTIGNLLRIGVLIAASVVFIGGIFYLVQYGSGHPDYHTFHGDSSQLRSVAAIFRGAASLQSPAIIQFGLLILVLTPIARVVFSAAGFALERDRMYVGITLVVLAVLLYSLLKIQ